MGYVKKATKGRIRPCFYLSLICLFSLFLFFPGTPVQGGAIELSQTGQTTCYNTAGNPIACDDTGQDGDFLAGVAWPAPRFSVTRFLDCIMDNLTGLMWSRNAYYPSIVADVTWSDSVSNPPAIYLCGYSDWRLPNVKEIQSLVNANRADNTVWLAEQGFIFRAGIIPTYWTSTSSAENPFVNAWNINMIDGSVTSESKGAKHLIWPVRGTSNPSTNIPPGQIAETGQIAVVANFDDAYFAISSTLNVGVPWPTPRFTESGDCVTDNLTGLMWPKNGNLDGLKTWGNALSYANGLTTCGYGDWRLPNSNEIISLIDRSQSAPALPPEHPFTNVQSGAGNIYWSSTSYAGDPDMAWTVDMLHGALGSTAKTGAAFVWPVRGGQTKPYVLTVKKEGTGRGTITADGLTCAGKTCVGSYHSYDEVIITATPANGSVFSEWTDCPTPSGNTCTITITDDTTIEATFLPEYKISVAPKSLSFKNLKQNIESAPLSVTITNVGVANLTISTIEIVEDSTAVFTITSNPADCAVIVSDASCSVTITATSPDYDTKTAELQIKSNDPKKPLTIVRLKARAKPPKIAWKPSSLNFGKAPLLSTTNKTLTVTNKGVTDLTFGAITKTGDNPDDLTFAPASCPTLATSETCTLTVTFTPSVAGKRNAILEIPSNDPKRSTLSVKLKGAGQ